MTYLSEFHGQAEQVLTWVGNAAAAYMGTYMEYVCAGGAGRHRATATHALRKPLRRAVAARGVCAHHATSPHRNLRGESGQYEHNLNPMTYYYYYIAITIMRNEKPS